MPWRTPALLRGSATGLVAVAAVLAAGPAAAPAFARPASARPASATQARPGFDFRTSPPASDALSGISCVTGSFCVAVGSYADPLGGARSLAEEWNGRTWRVMPGTLGTGLSDVWCASTTFCMAVGSPTQRWNGHGWKAVPIPPSVHPHGISCAGTSFCMAVGFGSQCEAAAVWHGSSWRALVMPSPCGPPIGGLARVSCVSRSRCLAVGSYMPDNEDERTLAEAWNGTRWRLLAAPSPGDGAADHLSGVSCATSAFCMAVGGVIVETSPQCGTAATLCDLALTWNGSAWQQLATPGAGGVGLTSVSCTDASHCVAIGAEQAFAWNGTTWTQLTIAQPGVTTLSDISCWRASACLAVGDYVTIDGAQLTLAQRWNGSTWRVRRTPSPGDAFSGLSGVSCPSPKDCVAVGTFIGSAGVEVTLAESWNGRNWRVLPPPADPGPHVNVMDAVSCPGARDCTAVGYYDSAGQHQALAEHWNGSSWQVQSVPHAGSLTAVSCASATSCVAVGSYLSASKRLALTVTWNGTTWTAQASPTPGGSLTEFAGISCPSASDCIAVGDYNTGVATPLLPFSAKWNGTTWSTLTTPVPGGGAGGLAAVSCPRSSDCMAVGSRFFRHGHDFPIRTLAESWNGSWTLRATPTVAGQLRPHLAAVSCARPTRCMAVGGYVRASGRGFALAESWNGTSWSLRPIPSPSRGFNDLYGISCPAATRCIAVGETGVQRTSAYLWNGTAWLRLRPPSP